MSVIRQSSLFDITAYTVEFDSVFQFKEIQEHFMEFLTSEYNLEPFKAVLEINELNELNNDEDIIEKCKTIIDHYIKSGSNFEVNISIVTKEKLMESFKTQLQEDEWVLDETAYEIFSPLKKTLISELRADNFPRFVRTKKCIEMISKYSNDPRVMKAITALKYPFTDETFEKPFITKDELDFMNELFLDSFAWESIYSKNKFNLFLSKMHFLPESKFLSNAHSFKMQTTYPYSFEKVANFIISRHYMEQTDPYITNFSVRETFSISNLAKKYPDDIIANQVHSIIAETNVQPPFPFNTPRKSIDALCLQYDKENRCLTYIRRPYLGDFKGKNIDWSKKMKMDFVDKSGEKKTVDGYLIGMMMMIKIEIIDAYTTGVSVITLLDPKGYISSGSSFFASTGGKIIGSQMEKAFSKGLKSMTNEVSLESFKTLKNEPMLNLVYKVMTRKNSFTKDDLFEFSYSDSDFNRPFIYDFEYDYFSKLSSSTMHWDLIYNHLDDKIYYSNSNFIPNSRVFQHTTNLMIQRTVNCSFEAFCFAFFGVENKQKMGRNSTKIQFVRKVNPEDSKVENLKMNDIPSFIMKNDKYGTFPKKLARKITLVESLKMTNNGSKIIGLSRPYLGDISSFEEFEEKLKFKVIDPKTDKEIEVEGHHAGHISFTEIERINDNQTKLSYIIIIDPKTLIPGKSAIKMVVTLFGKSMFKKLDELYEEIPKHFSLSNLNFKEENDPLVKILQDLFAQLHKNQ